MMNSRAFLQVGCLGRSLRWSSPYTRTRISDYHMQLAAAQIFPARGNYPSVRDLFKLGIPCSCTDG